MINSSSLNSTTGTSNTLANTPTISSPGIGSGLDVNTIVSKLMDVAQIPVTLLQKQQTTLQTQLSDYSQLANALSTFQTSMQNLNSLSKFATYTAQSNNTAAITATATNDASPGQHTLVVQQLASAHSIASAAFADSSSSINASGTLKLSVGSDSFNISVVSPNDTLAGISSAINSAADNTGVKASIINVDNGSGGSASRLVLTAIQSGLNHAITLTDTTGNVASQLNQNIQLTAAQDAKFTLDGFLVTRDSNIISDSLQGVTLNLLQGGGATSIITLTNDTKTSTTNIQNFVNNYNTLIQRLNSLSTGELQGDNSLLNIKNSLRGILNTAASVSGSFSRLSDIGITTQSDNTLSVNQTTLTRVLNNNFSDVAKLFATPNQGVAALFSNLATQLTSSNGVVSIRQAGINSRINNLTTQITQKQARIATLQQQYLNQFNSINNIVSKFQSTGTFLTQQIAALRPKSD